MKKLKNKNIDKIVFYVLISIFLFFIILNNKIGNMDEIWNFSSTRNLAKGLIPYKDFNTIVTPLSFFLNSIVLKINMSLFTFRIIYFIYYLIIIFLLDKILTTLKVNTNLVKIIILVFTFILVKICYLDYNLLQLIFTLLLIYLSLKNSNYQNKTLNIIIPIVSGLTIINKQNTGLPIATMNIILILFNKYYFKQNISFSFIIKQIIITTIPAILFIIYLFITNSYKEFYDLAILGLTTFSNKLFIPGLFIIVLCLYTLSILTIYLNRDKKELWIILFYSLTSLVCAYPIFDFVHASFAIVLSLILIAWVINLAIKKIPNVFTYLLSLGLIVLIILNAKAYFSSPKIKNGIYKYISAYEETETYINNISNYVLDKSSDYDVYILDMSAALFNINIDKYNKYFDIFLNGNFGVYGKKEMFNTINKDNNLLLINNADNNWQKPIDIIEYVKDKYQVCGNIDTFTIYCKNK